MFAYVSTADQSTRENTFTFVDDTVSRSWCVAVCLVRIARIVDTQIRTVELLTVSTASFSTSTVSNGFFFIMKFYFHYIPAYEPLKRIRLGTKLFPRKTKPFQKLVFP